MNDYRERIRTSLDLTLTRSNLPPSAGKKVEGKVRDRYEREDRVLFITTDRQSAFDRILASVPFKGQVLNLTSQWWFEQTEFILPNHLISVPDPAVSVGKKCKVVPIEFVLRGYITGSTSTSLWTQYSNGVRNYCGNRLPEGYVKNQRLPEAMLTPTTKEENHDRPISPQEIVSEGWMSRKDWDEASAKALELFGFGQKTAMEHGLILVDTKYEMGKDSEGKITLVDEIHTPDSSRYWLSEGYGERFAAGQEPDNIDKEFLRLWFVENCDPYKDNSLPKAPEDLIVELSYRYIQLFEKITGRPFEFPAQEAPDQRILRNIAPYLE